MRGSGMGAVVVGMAALRQVRVRTAFVHGRQRCHLRVLRVADRDNGFMSVSACIASPPFHSGKADASSEMVWHAQQKSFRHRYRHALIQASPAPLVARIAASRTARPPPFAHVARRCCPGCSPTRFAYALSFSTARRRMAYAIVYIDAATPGVCCRHRNSERRYGIARLWYEGGVPVRGAAHLRQFVGSPRRNANAVKCREVRMPQWQ